MSTRSQWWVKSIRTHRPGVTAAHTPVADMRRLSAAMSHMYSSTKASHSRSPPRSSFFFALDDAAAAAVVVVAEDEALLRRAARAAAAPAPRPAPAPAPAPPVAEVEEVAEAGAEADAAVADEAVVAALAMLLCVEKWSFECISNHHMCTKFRKSPQNLHHNGERHAQLPLVCSRRPHGTRAALS